MRIVHLVNREIKNLLEEDINVKTVSHGDIDLVALDKTSSYSLSHFKINAVTYGEYAWEVEVQLFCMDVVDISNDKEHDLRNIDFVQNDQLAVIMRLLDVLRRGDQDEIMLTGEPRVEFFEERFNDRVAGVEALFTITVPNDMTICDEEKSSASYYVRPSAPPGSYGNEDGSDYDNAWNGFSGIDWGVVTGNTLAICGVHLETLVVGSSNLTLIGNDANEPGTIDGESIRNRCISIENKSKITINSIKLINGLVDCLYLEDALNITTSNSVFSNSGNQGIQHFGSTTAVHNNPVCSGNIDDGISGHDSSYIEINGGVFSGNDQGVNIVGSSTAIIDENSIFSNNTTYDVWATNSDLPNSCSATIKGGYFSSDVKAGGGSRLILTGGVYSVVDVSDTLSKSSLSAHGCVINSLLYKGSDAVLNSCRILSIDNDTSTSNLTVSKCYIEPNSEWQVSGSLDATLSWLVGDGVNHTVFPQSTGVIDIYYCAFTGAGPNKFAITCDTGATINKLDNCVVYGDTLNRGFNLVDGLTINNIIVQNTERAFFAGSGITYTADTCVVFDAGSNDSGPGDVNNINQLTLDPLLVDPLNGNFELGLGSPAIGFGKSLSNLVAISHAYWGDENSPPSIFTAMQPSDWNPGITV